MNRGQRAKQQGKDEEMESNEKKYRKVFMELCYQKLTLTPFGVVRLWYITTSEEHKLSGHRSQVLIVIEHPYSLATNVPNESVYCE